MYTYLTSHRCPYYIACYIYPIATESHNKWLIHTNLPSSGQSQFDGIKSRLTSDNDVFCLAPSRTRRQNSFGRVTYSNSLSVNISSVLFSLSAFSISLSTSRSIACGITYQHSPSCNGMGRNTITLHIASGCHPYSYCMRHCQINTACQ